MVNFNRLFSQLFKQKSKTTYFIFMIQLATVLVISFFFIFKSTFKSLIGFLMAVIALIIGTSLIAEFIYLIITSWQNEKINRSQTWRLAPMSAGKIYLDNTLSSFVAYMYLFVLQVISCLLLVGLSYSISGQFRHVINTGFGHLTKDDIWINMAWSSINWTLVLESFVFFILLSLAFYITVSFFNFSTRAIIDFLPGMSSKFVVGIVRLILIILICWLIIKVLEILPADPLLDSQISRGNEDWYMARILVDFLIFDVVFGSINVGLIDKFVEAKQNN